MAHFILIIIEEHNDKVGEVKKRKIEEIPDHAQNERAVKKVSLINPLKSQIINIIT